MGLITVTNAIALAVPGVFDEGATNVLFERAYWYRSSSDNDPKAWLASGTTKYLPYGNADDASTIFAVVNRIVKKGWWEGVTTVYASKAPGGSSYNLWKVYVKWSHRSMNDNDKYNIVPHGWKLSTQDTSGSPLSFSISVAIGGSNVLGGFTVNLNEVDYKDTYVPITGTVTSGWLYLGWGKAAKGGSVVPIWEATDEYLTTGVFLMSWKNGYMKQNDGKTLYIKITHNAVFVKYEYRLAWIPTGYKIASKVYILGDGIYDQDAKTKAAKGSASLSP